MKLILTIILSALASTSIQAQSIVKQPDPRNSANLIYHEKLEKVLMLDGFIKEPLMEQIKIWSWDGKQWKLISDKGPFARTFGGIAYDSKRDKVVLYGGRSWPTEKMVIKEDTWEWDGKNWKQYADTSLTAINRHHLTMVYNKSNSKTILMSGVGLNKDKTDYIWPADMWRWDGSNWSQIVNSNGPSGRLTTIAYDSKRQEIVLFGGSSAEGQPEPLYNDTWIWNGKDWKKVSVTGPSARNGFAIAYDEDKGVTLLYGGWNREGYRRLGDMWQWNGVQWKEISLTGNTPGMRGGASMVYDPKRKKTILFGGENEKGKLNDTWEWDGEKWFEIKTNL